MSGTDYVAVEKEADSLESSGAEKDKRARMTWRRTVEAKTGAEKDWGETKALVENSVLWRRFVEAL